MKILSIKDMVDDLNIALESDENKVGEGCVDSNVQEQLAEYYLTHNRSPRLIERLDGHLNRVGDDEKYT